MNKFIDTKIKDNNFTCVYKTIIPFRIEDLSYNTVKGILDVEITNKRIYEYNTTTSKYLTLNITFKKEYDENEYHIINSYFINLSSIDDNDFLSISTILSDISKKLYNISPDNKILSKEWFNEQYDEWMDDISIEIHKKEKDLKILVFKKELQELCNTFDVKLASYYDDTELDINIYNKKNNDYIDTI